MRAPRRGSFIAAILPNLLLQAMPEGLPARRLARFA
jgi:hypothetical protein